MHHAAQHAICHNKRKQLIKNKNTNIGNIFASSYCSY
ncbi:hypothetical protein SAMN05192555_1107 [Franzmannia pantelleriensis]|uniref:Uncharacterized protein n=1 Tax=Franzmannia pantelleriensis TaxID=48727 RepID=A0A1G9R153_9GAMM|nr:hypothetical protein SAMN05192555_1107 [Halomonas pantelleriensis]